MSAESRRAFVGMNALCEAPSFGKKSATSLRLVPRTTSRTSSEDHSLFTDTTDIKSSFPDIANDMSVHCVSSVSLRQKSFLLSNTASTIGNGFTFNSRRDVFTASSMFILVLSLFVALSTAQDVDLSVSLSGAGKGFRIFGSATNDYSGYSVCAAGDVNDDGFDDIIVGAYGADPPGKSDAGVSYVIFGRDGRASAFADIQLPNGITALSPSVGFRILGAAAGDFSGRSVGAAGDVNHDGIADVIVGAYGANPGSGSQAGISYVIFGRSATVQATNPFGDIQLPTTTMPDSIGFRILGASGVDQSGMFVGPAGDINDDGIDDFVVGAYMADPPSGANAGISYVIFGRNIGGGDSPFGDIQLTSGNAVFSLSIGFRILGAATGDESGISIGALGDVNGDDIDDIVVGAAYTAAQSLPMAGISYVIFGRSAATQASHSFGDIQLPTTTMAANIGFRILGAADGDNSGICVKGAGDVNYNLFGYVVYICIMFVTVGFYWGLTH